MSIEFLHADHCRADLNLGLSVAAPSSNERSFLLGFDGLNGLNDSVRNHILVLAMSLPMLSLAMGDLAATCVELCLI